jgi:hypothetical protein
MTNNILISYPHRVSNDYWDLRVNDHIQVEEQHDQAILNLDSLVCEGDESKYRLRLKRAADAVRRNIEKVIISPSEQNDLINLLKSTYSKLLEVDKQCRPHI